MPVKPSKRGRPSKYDPERAEQILLVIQNGGSRETAAEYAGVDRSTLFRWINEFCDLRDAIKKADAQFEMRHLQNISNAARGNPEEGRLPVWQASAWILERKFPERWRQRSSVENVIPADSTKPPDEWADRVMEIYGLDVNDFKTKKPGGGGRVQ